MTQNTNVEFSSRKKKDKSLLYSTLKHPHVVVLLIPNKPKKCESASHLLLQPSFTLYWQHGLLLCSNKPQIWYKYVLPLNKKACIEDEKWKGGLKKKPAEKMTDEKTPHKT